MLTIAVGMAKEREPMVSVQLSADANARLDGYCEQQHKIKRETLSAIVLWFLAQPPKVRRVVDGVDEGMEDAYADALEELARQVRQGKHRKRPAKEIASER